jgi:hypothetical protein
LTTTISIPLSGTAVQVLDIVYAPELELSIVLLSGLLEVLWNVSFELSSAHLSQPSPTNAPVVLSIDSLGVLNDDMRGFYRSKEDAHNRAQRRAITMIFSESTASLTL